LNSSGGAALEARRVQACELLRDGIGKTLNDSVNAACRTFDGMPIAIS
jgi:hypothetical protein